MHPTLAWLLLGLAAAGGACAIGLVHAAEGAPEGAVPMVVERELEANLDGATLRQLEILRLLVQAAHIMDALYREQVEGGGFYPADMSREEFDAWTDPAAAHPYTVVRRDALGALQAVPYHEAWPRELGRAARLLAQAAEITSDESLRNYLTQRARALITGDDARAEAAWRAMRYSDLDVLIGPIFRDADRRFGLKAGFGAYVMLRDWGWGARLAAYTVFLPRIQASLPVSGAFKAEVPEVDMKVAVYDLLFQAGYGAVRADSVTAEELGEPRLRIRQGPQRLQLRNVTQARFDALVLPVAEALLVPEQRAHVRFEPFFLNTLFHELAHGLGMKQTVAARGPVRDALGEHADTIEELKAAVLSLWLANWLHANGELPDTAPMDHYASLLAGVFRAVHVDADSAAGRAHMLLFNYFRDWGAFRRDAATGRYRVDAAAVGPAIAALAAQVLTLQGSGDHEGAAELIGALASPRAEFRADLARLAAAGIPAAVAFRQPDELPGL
jgi:hypothetical protein